MTRHSFPFSLSRILVVLTLFHTVTAAEAAQSISQRLVFDGSNALTTAESSASTALASGVKTAFSLPLQTGPTLFSGDYSYTIFVPVGATQLKIDMETTATANIGLYARFGRDVSLVNGGVVADSSVQTTSGTGTITINPPQPGTYFISFAVFSSNSPVTGSVTATLTLASNDLIVPQFVNGGGWTTSLFLSNVSSSAESYTIRFFDNSGAPRQVPLVGLGTQSSINGVLAPGQVAVFEATDADALSAGWADVTPFTSTSTRLNGFTVFRFHSGVTPDSEAIVTPGTLNDRTFMVVYDNASGFSSGVALVNPNPTPVTLSIVIRDQNGSNIGSDNLTLAAKSQMSFFIGDRYSATADKKGSLLISGVSGFSAVGLRFAPGFTSFTSFPPLK